YEPPYTTVIETITTDIIDGPVALGEITLPKDEEYIIVEDGVPLGNLPKTGTAANIGAGAAGMIMTISALAGAGATLLKKEDA
ncbi:MAG: LPXTG cell wall anchor domain-containing protein, partial [Clostridiales bacterium]|nr:LPXTG cell wall anchor domain-containing protein [Clostridiales bacterium]